jgi:hypothetical protein
MSGGSFCCCCGATERDDVEGAGGKRPRGSPRIVGDAGAGGAGGAKPGSGLPDAALARTGGSVPGGSALESAATDRPQTRRQSDWGRSQAEIRSRKRFSLHDPQWSESFRIAVFVADCSCEGLHSLIIPSATLTTKFPESDFVLVSPQSELRTGSA